MIKIKRIYDKPEKSDGFRVLVDRLWPRGLSKTDAKISLWLKDIAPSNELRRWFLHDVKKWPEFQKRYKQELKSKKELIDKFRKLEKKYRTVTVLFSARDVQHNNAVVLRKCITK